MASLSQESRDIVFLDEKACRDENLVGGKAFGLANLAERFRVPPGFCITSKALRSLGPSDSFTKTLTESVQHAYKLLGEKCGEINPSVAVRSSAVGEDSATASFAGIHETYLNVKGDEAVVRAVKNCVVSAFSERAAEYRRRNLDSQDLQIAVLVQKMVPGEAAVIAFTTNPVTGSSEELVINATLGLGEELASGRITPDSYVVRKADRAIIHRKISDKPRTLMTISTDTQETNLPTRLQSSPALTDSQLSKVVELALQVEDALGYPVDVEAAWAAGQLFLLQARPITTGFPATLEGEDANLDWEWEVGHFPTPVPPLSADAVQVVFEGAALRFRKDGKPINLLCRIFNGYVYLALRYLTSEEDIPKAQEKINEVNRAKMRELADYWQNIVMPHLMETYSWMQHTSIETHSASELAKAWQELWRRVRDLWEIHWGLTGPARKSLEDLAEAYTSLFPGASSAEALTLVQGLSVSLNQVQRDLYGLASLARSLPSVSGIIMTDRRDPLSGLGRVDGGQQFQERFREFLKTHGHLGKSTVDIQQPSWEEDPPSAIEEVRRFLMSDRADPEVEQKRLIAEAEELARRRRAQLRDRPEDLARLDAALKLAREAGPITEEHNYWLDRMLETRQRQFILRVADRLAKMSVISQPSDMFFLHIDEVPELVVNPHDMSAKIAVRRKTLDSWKRLRAPLYLGKRRSEEGTGSSSVQEGFIDSRQSDEAKVLKGESASLGLARGPLKIVLVKDDFQNVKPGDILVCHNTNPSWVPLFYIAGGLVSDEGGVLSHAAVIAREFGLPAVVGVKDATLRLRDGQIVEVDGDAGLVRMVSDKN